MAIEDDDRDVAPRLYERHGTPRGISYLTSTPNTSRQYLICVHGWACRSTDYTALLEALCKTNPPWKLIAIDLPGHGGSSKDHYADGSLSSMADAVEDVIDEVDADEVVLCGHSMGMRVVLQLWQRWRRRQDRDKKPTVKGLVFLDGSHYRLRKSLFAFDSGDARSKNLSPEERIAGMQEAFKRMFSPRTPLNFQESTLQHVRRMDLDYSDAMRKSFVAFDLEDMDATLEALGKSETRLLSLQATDVDDGNQRVSLKSGQGSKWMRFLQEKVPRAEQIVILESLHFPHVDQPLEVARRISTFLMDGM